MEGLCQTPSVYSIVFLFPPEPLNGGGNLRGVSHPGSPFPNHFVCFNLTLLYDNPADLVDSIFPVLQYGEDVEHLVAPA